jgi:hypothetical protein
VDAEETGEEFEVVVEGEEVDDEIEVTAVLPTENVVERFIGAGSENISFVGALQFTVSPSDSVPQQFQTCDRLLYTMSARGRSPTAGQGYTAQSR